MTNRKGNRTPYEDDGERIARAYDLYDEYRDGKFVDEESLRDFLESIDKFLPDVLLPHIMQALRAGPRSAIARGRRRTVTERGQPITVIEDKPQDTVIILTEQTVMIRPSRGPRRTIARPAPSDHTRRYTLPGSSGRYTIRKLVPAAVRLGLVNRTDAGYYTIPGRAGRYRRPIAVARALLNTPYILRRGRRGPPQEELGL